MTGADASSGSGEGVQVSGLRANGNAHQFLVADGNMTVQTSPPPPHVPIPRQLPMDVTAFTGRDAELRRLDRILDRSGSGSGFANAVISGPGGVGKTGLAVHWAHRIRDRFTDGDLYIDLHGYSPDRPLEPMDALAQLLGSFGLSDSELPQRLSDRAARYRSLLYGRRMLIVLDNASSNEQIRELLPGSATCAIVITSRDRLDSFTTRYGGTSLSLEVLRPDDSIELLGGLVGERVANEPEAARAMAEACGHHALALRIAATSATTRPDTPLTTLADDLGRALGRSGVDTLSIGDDPHTDLRAVFSWSLRDLSAEAHRAFVMIGLLPVNVLDIYGLAALWGLSLDQAAELTEALVGAHLLSRSRASRYTMHDLLRAYANRLAAEELTPDERARAVDGLLHYYAGAASKAMDVYFPIEKVLRPEPLPFQSPVPEFGDAAAALAWLDTERVNLLATASWAADHDRLDHTCRMASTIFRYLDTSGSVYHNDRLQSIATRASDPAQRGRALEHLSVVYQRTGRYEKAVECSRQAIDLAREAGDIPLEAASLANLGNYYGKFAQHEDSLECLERALAMILNIGPQFEIARMRNLLGRALTNLCRFEEAEQHLHIALAMFREGKDSFFQSVVQYKIGLLRLKTGDPEKALATFEASKKVFEQIGNHNTLPDVMNSIGTAYRELGKLDSAVKHHCEALEMSREFAVVDCELTILNDLALTYTAQNRLEEAIEHHRLAHGLARQHGNQLELKRAKDGLKTLAAL